MTVVTARPHAAVEPSSLRRAPVLPVLLVLAVGLGLRLWRLSVQSLSMDEVFELNLAAKPAAAIVVSRDGFPPLYHLVAHWWLRATENPESLRFLSVIFGILTIAVIWQLGRLAAGERCGIVSAFLLAVSPIHVWFSQEARAYGLYFLLAVSMMWLFYRARATDRSRDWAWYLVVASLGAYTHYYMTLLVFALLLTAGFEPRPPGTTRRLVAVHLALAVFCLPLLFLIQGDLALQQSIDPVRPATDLVALGYAGYTFLGGFTLGPSLGELHYIRAAAAVQRALPWILLMGAASLYLVRQALLDRSHRAWVVRLALLTLVPLGISGLLAEGFGVGFRVRYVVWCAAPLLTLIALGAAYRLNRWPTWLALAALVTSAVVALINRHALPRRANEDMRGAAHYLAGVTTPTTPIFIAAGYMEPALRFYLQLQGTDRNVQPVFRADWLGDSTPPISKMHATTGSNRTFWLVYARAFDGDPRGLLLDSLQARARLSPRLKLAGVEIYEAAGFQGPVPPPRRNDGTSATRRAEVPGS
jgi:4-amino-4-deoxy-L-arabinose transferase-like glycosyltransferase